MGACAYFISIPRKQCALDLFLVFLCAGVCLEANIPIGPQPLLQIPKLPGNEARFTARVLVPVCFPNQQTLQVQCALDQSVSQVTLTHAESQCTFERGKLYSFVGGTITAFFKRPHTL